MEKRVRGFETVKNAPSDTILPKRKTKKSCCYDMYLPCDVKIKPLSFSKAIQLNVKAYMQDNESLELYTRSSVAIKKKCFLINCVGQIDADYYSCEENDGNIGIMLFNASKKSVSFKKGERIVQAKFVNYLIADGDDADGERKGGVGSTGEN